MVRRLAKDESGMTMGLVVIMIVLIGVMGAGLLTFVSTDLNAVVEVNRGQRAFEAADAGVQAAKKQLLTDPTAIKYGGVDSAANDVQWSPNVSNASCPTVGSAGMCFGDMDGDGSTPDAANVTIQAVTTPANSFRVVSTGGYGNGGKRKIEAILELNPGVRLRPEFYTGQDFSCASNGQFAGNVLNFVAEDDAVFNSNCEITMNSGNIYVGGSTADGGVTAQFDSNTSITNGSILVNGSASFNSNVNAGGGGGIYVRDNATFSSNTVFGNVSRMYVGGNASFDSNSILANSSAYVGGTATFNSNSGLNGTSLFAGGNVVLSSNNFSLGNDNDATYGNWQNSFNPTARNSVKTGIGAVGTISGAGTNKAFTGSRSYDRTTGNGTTTGTRFVAPNAVPPASSPRRMTFPFNPTSYSQPLTDAAANAGSSRLTADDVNALRTIAQQQETATGRDHYREVPNGTRTIRETGTDQWPTASSDLYGYGTVVFYKFPSISNTNKVMWDINALCTDTSRKGIIVVENGSFLADGSSGGFNGWVVVRDGTFTTDSNACINAFVNSTGGLTANSNSQINTPPETAQEDLARFRTMITRGWRECYNDACS